MAAPQNPNAFTDNPLDRAAHLRADKAWLAASLKAPDTRIVPLWQLKPLILPPRVDGPAGTPGPSGVPGTMCDIGWYSPHALADVMRDDATLVFLGQDNGRAHFAVDIGNIQEPDTIELFSGIGAFQDLRQTVPQLTGRDASILAQAKSLIDWHARHRFCACCGGATTLVDAGYRRTCQNCDANHFPRTDPVVISAVIDGDRCLLGRGAHFPDGMFSTLAGFVEPGESIEEAVAREVFEEVGVHVDNVRIHSSQPWPYASSLMIGCLATATSTAITIDDTEIVEARWFTRDELAAALARQPEAREAPNNPGADFWVPPAFAIAHQLIKAFVDGDLGRQQDDA